MDVYKTQGLRKIKTGALVCTGVRERALSWPSGQGGTVGGERQACPSRKSPQLLQRRSRPQPRGAAGGQQGWTQSREAGRTVHWSILRGLRATVRTQVLPQEQRAERHWGLYAGTWHDWFRVALRSFPEPWLRGVLLSKVMRTMPTPEGGG